MSATVRLLATLSTADCHVEVSTSADHDEIGTGAVSQLELRVHR
jgi:hypothetical protein